MIIRLNFLLLLALASLPLCAADNAKPQEEQKAEAQQEVLKGELRVIPFFLPLVQYEVHYQSNQLRLRQTYSLKDNDQLIQTCFCPVKCNDPSGHSGHNTLGIYEFPEFLPCHVPIATKKNLLETIHTECPIKIAPLINIIIQYAYEKFCLAECNENDLIEIQVLSKKGIKTLELKCARFLENHSSFESAFEGNFWKQTD